MPLRRSFDERQTAMLSQLIYTSQAHEDLSPEALQAIASAAARNNARVEVSGLLIYDQGCFLQVMEGEDAVILALYQRLKKDTRHTNVVKLIHEPIAQRRFAQWNMGLAAPKLGVQSEVGIVGLSTWSELLASHALQNLTEDRVRTVLDAFTQGRWHHHVVMRGADAVPPTRNAKDPELFIPGRQLSPAHRELLPASGPLFAYQPIVDFQTRRISSYEALLRGPGGESPHSVLGAFTGEALHRFDLTSKVAALSIAQQLGTDARLSLNLLPKSLLADANAVDFLVQAAARHGFTPDRIVLEVTEEEAITDPDLFADAVKRVRSAGMRVAIDDFGAGFAGLSLLADFQPDKLKIDRCIVQNVHESGPRQAIVRAIVEFCYCLGIAVVAEGVETVQEFNWLRHAGVNRIQGFLIARPELCALPPVQWQG